MPTLFFFYNSQTTHTKSTNIPFTINLSPQNLLLFFPFRLPFMLKNGKRLVIFMQKKEIGQYISYLEDPIFVKKY